jgi:hypothetical protein
VNAQLSELAVEIGGRFQQEGVQSVAGPGVIVPEPMIDQQWQPQLVRLRQGKDQGMIVPGSERALHPVEHVLSVGAWPRLVSGVDPEIVDHPGASAAFTMLRSIPAKTSW